MQYDYLPGGEMEVKGGDRVLPQIHRLLDEGNWDLIIASQVSIRSHSGWCCLTGD